MSQMIKITKELENGHHISDFLYKDLKSWEIFQIAQKMDYNKVRAVKFYITYALCRILPFLSFEFSIPLRDSAGGNLFQDSDIHVEDTLERSGHWLTVGLEDKVVVQRLDRRSFQTQFEILANGNT